MILFIVIGYRLKILLPQSAFGATQAEGTDRRRSINGTELRAQGAIILRRRLVPPDGGFGWRSGTGALSTERQMKLLMLRLPFSYDPVYDNTYQSSEEAPYRGEVLLEEDTRDEARCGHEESQKPHLPYT